MEKSRFLYADFYCILLTIYEKEYFKQFLKKMTSMARILKVLHVQQLPNNFCSISMRAMICAIISRKVLFENRGNSIIAKYH